MLYWDRINPPEDARVVHVQISQLRRRLREMNAPCRIVSLGKPGRGNQALYMYEEINS